MAHHGISQSPQAGFSFTELVLVVAGSMVLAAVAVPFVNTVSDQYRFVLVAQGIASQVHYARMKAVTSNEEIRVNFPAGGTTYQVESSTGSVIAGPFYLPGGITWNSACGTAVTFPGYYLAFQPLGNLPASGNGSAGRAKIVNRAGRQIDIVVSPGGIIRQTTSYAGCTPPF